MPFRLSHTILAVESCSVLDVSLEIYCRRDCRRKIYVVEIIEIVPFSKFYILVFLGVKREGNES